MEAVNDALSFTAFLSAAKPILTLRIWAASFCGAVAGIQGEACGEVNGLADHRYEEIGNVPDRLRWLRHSRGLMQTEAARLIGVSVSTYKSMKKGRTHRIPQERSERLAQLFDVQVIVF